MATLAQVKAAVRARLDANFTAIPVRYQREDTEPPRDIDGRPQPFVFVEFDLDGPEYAGFGGGRGANLQRVTGDILAHVMVPVGWGDADADGWGETIAALFRSYRDSSDLFSCFAAEPIPGTGKTEDGSYAHAVMVVIDMHYDKVG